MADDLQALIDEQDSDIEHAAQSFKKKSNRAIRRAITALLLLLGAKLVLDKAGRIKATTTNLKVLQSAPDLLANLLLKNGYAAALGEIRAALEQQAEVFAKVAEHLDIPANVTATEKILRDQAIENRLAALSMEPTELLRRQVYFAGDTFLGEDLESLSDSLIEPLLNAPGALAIQAGTGTITFYRSISERAYDALQADKKEPIRYRYYGPSSGDPKIRPFCKHLMAETEQGKTFTRAEIDNMDNGQLPNVFLVGGGYNCRHQWVPWMHKNAS